MGTRAAVDSLDVGGARVSTSIYGADTFGNDDHQYNNDVDDDNEEDIVFTSFLDDELNMTGLGIDGKDGDLFPTSTDLNFFLEEDNLLIQGQSDVAKEASGRESRLSSQAKVPSPSSSDIEPKNLIAKEDKRKTKQDRRRQQVLTAVKKYRRRKKDELDYLRTKVQELQEKLESLQKDAHVLGKRAPEEIHGLDWEEKAREQQRRRIISEQENTNLRYEVAKRMQFAQSLQELFAKSAMTAFLPVEELGQEPAKAVSTTYLTLGTNKGKRTQDIYAVTDKDFMDASDKLAEAGLSMSVLSQLPYTNSEVKSINGVYQIEVTKVIFYDGYTAEQVANVMSSIFWAEVDLPELPNGTEGVEYEELDQLDSDTSYARFVCPLGTKNCHIAGLEKLVIRRRKLHGTPKPTIVWRTVANDVLHPGSGKFPRVNEDGCLTIENSSYEGQSGSLLKMMIHICPPGADTFNFPAGAVVDSYMNGFMYYMSEIEQLVGLMLLMSSFSIN